MFNLNDYWTIESSGQGGRDVNPQMTINLTFDQKKLKDDVEILKATLCNLEHLLGPYTIRVDSKKLRVKKKKKKDKKST